MIIIYIAKCTFDLPLSSCWSEKFVAAIIFDCRLIASRSERVILRASWNNNTNHCMVTILHERKYCDWGCGGPITRAGSTSRCCFTERCYAGTNLFAEMFCRKSFAIIADLFLPELLRMRINVSDRANVRDEFEHLHGPERLCACGGTNRPVVLCSEVVPIMKSHVGSSSFVRYPESRSVRNQEASASRRLI